MSSRASGSTFPDPAQERMIRYKLWDLPSLECSFGKTGSEPGLLDVRVSEGFSETQLPDDLTAESLVNAVSTLKQLFSRDGPGYGRIGFDSRLWGFEEWKPWAGCGYERAFAGGHPLSG